MIEFFAALLISTALCEAVEARLADRTFTCRADGAIVAEVVVPGRVAYDVPRSRIVEDGLLADGFEGP